jgi:tetratricopeptide (TPR) repeat protein
MILYILILKLAHYWTIDGNPKINHTVLRWQPMNKPCFVPLLFLVFLLLASCAPARSKLKLAEGNIFFSRGMYKEAVASYLEAAKEPGTAPYAAFALGSVYYELGQNDAALLRFKEVEESASYPDNRELIYRCRYNSGIVRFKNGDFEGASADFKGALEADPARVPAKLNLELSMLSLLQRQDSALVRTTQQGSVSEDSERRKREILFNFVRRKESDKWKSWDFSGEEENAGPDY